MLPISSPSCITPRRRGAPQGNKNALGHGAPRGNKNGLGHGAPRGNRNALKFGVYTREFNRPMIQPPGMSLMEALELEVNRIRLFVRDELASVRPARSDLVSNLAILRAVTIAVGRIDRLHRSILALQTSRLFESCLGRSIARKLALFPAAAHELVPSSSTRLSPSPACERYCVHVGNQSIGRREQDNCLLVPLFLPERMDSGPPAQ